MNDRFHDRGPGGARRIFLRRRILCGEYFLLLAALLTLATVARNQNHQPLPAEKRLHYQIHLTLDFESRTYDGVERVRWINRGDHPTSTVSFIFIQTFALLVTRRPQRKRRPGS